MLNGEPVTEPLARFAAGPTFLLIMIITGALMVLLFLGVGLFMFLLVYVDCSDGNFYPGALFLAGADHCPIDDNADHGG